MTRNSILHQAIALLALSISLVLPAVANAKHSVVLHVGADANNDVKITTQQDSPRMPEKDFVVPHEAGQVGIQSVKIAKDGYAAGWVLLYEGPDASTPNAGKLVVWRDGRVVHSFTADQVFWSWAFQQDGRQVAYHVGPTHGETTSHCELHDVRTGRLLASWNGDLDNPNRPEWTKSLDH